jgi:hypothetical protein
VNNTSPYYHHNIYIVLKTKKSDTMFSNQTAEISIHGSCRAIDAIWGDKMENRFIVGSSALHSSSSFGQQENNATPNNRLVIVQFQTESNELQIETELDHFTGGVSAICSHPTDPTLVVTATEENCGATLWKLPSKDEYRQHAHSGESENENHGYFHSTRNNARQSQLSESSSMERMASFQSPDTSLNSSVTCVAWKASDETSGDVLTIDTEGNLTQWDVSFGAADAVKNVSVNDNPDNKYYYPPPRVRWDPHSNSGDTLATSFGADVHILDWRIDTSTPSGTVDSLKGCHLHGVTDIHYNPNKPYVLATGGKVSPARY